MTIAREMTTRQSVSKNNTLFTYKINLEFIEYSQSKLHSNTQSI